MLRPDNGALHKARALRLPLNLGLQFFPPYSLALNPIERLWRGLKDGLACYQSTSLEELSELLCVRLNAYSAVALRSLTGFRYLLTAAQTVTVL